jgi:Family of unknown function (DUF6035)
MLGKKMMKVKPLLIPYALKLGGFRVPGEVLATMPKEEFHSIRVNAFRLEREGLPAEYCCPFCHSRLYPTAPTPVRRAHWTHFGKHRPACPLDVRRSLTDDEVAAIIFNGRQESDRHRKLRLDLLRWAENDPDTDPNSCTSDEYLRPEEGTGCYPDVRFCHNGRWIVLEVQLAPASLTTIARRHSFYAKQKHGLLWVTANFDPSLCVATSVWDITADQHGALLSVDAEVEALIEVDGKMRFRAFTLSRETQKWVDQIILLHELEIDDDGVPVLQDQWAKQYKAKWIETAGADYHRCKGIICEAIEKARLDKDEVFGQIELERLTQIVNLLIAIEKGEVVGGFHKNLKGLIGSTAKHNAGKRAGALIKRALEKYQPVLIDWPVVPRDLDQRVGHPKQWGRGSFLGKLRDILFPNWKLA